MSYSLDYVRETYGVPARRGLRVTTEAGEQGVITSGDGNAGVRVRLDGHAHSAPYHPNSLDYGDGITPAARTAHRNARIVAWNLRLNQRISAEEYRERISVPLTPSYQPEEGDHG